MWLCLKLNVFDCTLGVDSPHGTAVAGGIAVVACTEDCDCESIVLFFVSFVADFVRSQNGSDLVELTPLLGNVAVGNVKD
jgi:hypothetical protein